MINKKDIRKEILALRRSMSKSEQVAKSDIITQKIIDSLEFKNSRLIFCYVSLEDEVSTDKIIETAIGEGKIVAVPKVIGSEMEFFKITSLLDLEKAYFGIREPKEEIVSNKNNYVIPTKYQSQDILMIMPGVAFDKKGNRLGFGGGFYDKYLEKYPIIKTIAVAFDIQIVEKLPTEANDIKPGRIVTNCSYNY